jgi:hypothetical protein
LLFWIDYSKYHYIPVYLLRRWTTELNAQLLSCLTFGHSAAYNWCATSLYYHHSFQLVHHHCFHYYHKAKSIALVSSSLLSEKKTLSITMVTINYHHDNNTSGITFFSEENKKKERSLFVLFLLAIVLSVLLRYTGSDYPFGIFKLFFYNRSISVILITIIL